MRRADDEELEIKWVDLLIYLLMGFMFLGLFYWRRNELCPVIDAGAVVQEGEVMDIKSKQDSLVFIESGVPETLMSFNPRYIVIGNSVVTISLEDGSVTYADSAKLDEAAKMFWDAVKVYIVSDGGEK
jgi:hypothetical protein